MPPPTLDLSLNDRRKTSQTSCIAGMKNACTRRSDAQWLVALYTRLGRLCVRWLYG